MRLTFGSRARSRASTPPTEPLPSRLQGFPLIRSKDLDESVWLQSSLTAPCEAEQIDRDAPFYWHANRIVCGPLAVVASAYGACIRGSTENVDAQYSLMVPLSSAGRVAQPGMTADLVPGRRAVITSTSLPADFLLGTGYRGFAVKLPAATVEGVLAGLTGAPITKPVRFELAVDTRVGGAGVLQLLELIVAGAERDASFLSWSIVQERFAEALVSALLLGVPHSHSALLRPVDAAEPAYVRRAEEYLAANAHRHIGVADVARAVRIGVRALTAAFRRHRGCTPAEFLRQRRFELARQRLLSPAATSVSQVALSCGFEHLGRFSVGYRARFGEGASETLRRGRAAAGLG